MDPIVVDIPGVGPVEFPATMSQDQINVAAKNLHDEANKEPVVEKENPELFGYGAASAGAIGAAGDIIYSKSRPLIRMAETAGKKLTGIPVESTPAPRTFADPATVAQRAIDLRTVPPEIPGGATLATKNWADTQHTGNFLGGSEYGEADKIKKEAMAFEKANPNMKVQPGSLLAIPEHEAQLLAKQKASLFKQQNIQNQAEVNAAAQTRAERLMERDNLKHQQARKNILKSGTNIAGKIAFPIAGGYEAGTQGAQAYNRLTRPDMTAGDVASGVSNVVGSAAGALSMVPSKYRIPAAILSQGAGALANILDKRNPRNEEVEQKAAGGAIQHFSGLTSGAVKLAAKMSPGIEESLGKILPKSKPLTLAEKFGYDPVKLRNEYPQTSFPVSAWDKNKEAYYAAKNPSSEELALKAARDFAQEEIKSGSSAYKPYFDISKRGYVDPSNYPLPGPQTTSVIPKQQKTIDAYTAKFQNPEAIQKWSDAYELAKNSPNAHHFYAMDQLEKEYVKAYGPELGRHKFKTEFADQMANTTSGVTPTNNLLTAAYVNHMNASGLPLPGHALGEYSGYSFDAPHPVQGGRIGANLAQSNKYAEAGNQLNPLENPKRYDFSGNFMGHPGLTMDEQMMTPFGMAAPPKGSYGLAELEGAKQAALKGVTVPSDWQSVTWAGLKALKDSKGKELSPDELSKIGQPMIEDVNQAIHRTSRVLNISPKEALDQLLKNKPMYGIGAIGAGASQNEEPQTKKAGGKIDFLAFKIKQNIKKKK
jgi:hypothetical protein